MFQINHNIFLSTLPYQDIAYLIVDLLLFIPFLLIILDSFFRCLFLIVTWLPYSKTSSLFADQRVAGSKILYLFVANNEQKVIGESIETLQQVAELTPDDSIVVLADHCIDRTAEIANLLGVKVYHRTDGKLGKSEALSWFAFNIAKQIEFDIIVVLDADTLAGENLSSKLKLAFDKELDAVQVFVHPIPSSNSPISLLVSYSELLSQKIDDVARSRLGWSVPLRGTGMAFRKNIFEKICLGINTQVDDIELSLLLLEMGSTVHYCSEAEVLDSKANNILGLARQRGRWLKGQRYIWNTQRQNFVKLLKLGLPNWSLVQSLILKPKTALLTVKIMLACILVIVPYGVYFYQTVFFLVWSSILVDLLYYLTGLRYAPNPIKICLAMFSAPMLFLLWFISWGFSLFPNQGWLWAREK